MSKLNFLLALHLGVVLLLSAADAIARERTDVVWLKNGDRVTGEIKELERGKLRVKTDSMGDVYIEWGDIATFNSVFAFQFELLTGQRFTGSVSNESGAQTITMTTAQQKIELELDSVVRISQIESSFWQRLHGSLSFGYNFTKASDVAQTNLSFSIDNRTEIRKHSLSGSAILTSDQASQSTQSSNLSFDTTRFRSNRWFNLYVAALESNDELGLDLRSSIGAGIGRFLHQTDHSEFALVGGALATYEQLQGQASSQENLEGLLGLGYSRFLYDDPMIDLNVSLLAYPSFTTSGRVRAQLDINLRWELIKDLYWDLTYYNTYDSDPPSGSLSTNDYGVVTSLGWSY